MSGTEVAHYLDTSALVKLVVEEPETEALRGWLAETDGEWVSSDLTRTELLPAVRRVVPERLVLARQVLDAITLVDLRTSTFEEAARLDPPHLRTLDALHLAAALDLGDDLQDVVTYDERLAEAATGNGIATIAPD